MPRVRSRLQLRLHAGFLVVALVGLGIAAFLVDRNVARTTLSMVEERLSNQAMMLGQMTASALFGPLDESDSGLNDDIRRLGRSVHAHLSLITPDGRVVADSEVTEPLRLPAEGSVPEVVAARTSGRGVSVRDGRNGSHMFVAQAIIRDGKVLGYSRSSLSMDAVMMEVRAVRIRMAWGAAMAAAVAVILAFVISTRIVRPIRALTEGARRIEAGDLLAKISVPSGDEIAELADAFNQMTGSLRGTIAKLDSRNQDMRLVLDTVNDGLIVIDRDGSIGAEHSAAVEKWFGPITKETKLWDYLTPGDARAARMFELGWEAVCDGILPLPLTLAQMPHRLSRGDQIFELVYEPILVDGDLAQTLVVLSDVTQKVEAERAVAEQREFVEVVERLVKDRGGLMEFVTEADATVRRLTGSNRTQVDLQRDIHTLRGDASVYGLSSLAEYCRSIETRMHETGEPPEAQALVELDARWRRFHSRLLSLIGARAPTSIEVDEADHDAILRAVQASAPRSELIKMIEELKLDPVEKGLSRLALQAEVLAERLGKGQVTLACNADRIRIDRDRWRPLWAALGHVVRNAIDHGLEARDERLALGKPKDGRITLSATLSGRAVVIEIADDGRGIDWEALGARAASKGVQAQKREDLLFAHGLSTRADVTEYSGRGVGLGAVRAACESLGGRIEVTSTRGQGTRFRFIVPPAEAVVTKGPKVHS